MRREAGRQAAAPTLEGAPWLRASAGGSVAHSAHSLFGCCPQLTCHIRVRDVQQVGRRHACSGSGERTRERCDGRLVSAASALPGGGADGSLRALGLCAQTLQTAG